MTFEAHHSQRGQMPVPPPPPPPPPPPSFSNNNPQTLTTQKATGARAMLLGEIHKGTRLKKTVTNDRSGPAVEGKIVGDETGNKSSAVKMAVSSTANQKTLAPKPGGGGAMGLGDLFKDGVPRKPSDLKMQKSTANINQSVTSNTLRTQGVQKTTDAAPVKKTPPLAATGSGGDMKTVESRPALSSCTETTANKSTRAAAIANLQKSISTVGTPSSAPPPLPAKLPKQMTTSIAEQQQPSKLPLSQLSQFQTLRPSKTQHNSENNKMPLRRAGSTEEIQKRPSAPPPPPIMRRPGGPPPPPPPLARPVQIVAPATKKVVQPPMTNDKGLTLPRVEAEPSPPLPPPRVSSYLESMEQRFHFVPISELPPPPKFVGFRKEYAHLQLSR